MLSTNIDCYKVCLVFRLVGHPLGPLAGGRGSLTALPNTTRAWLRPVMGQGLFLPGVGLSKAACLLIILGPSPKIKNSSGIGYINQLKPVKTS